MIFRVRDESGKIVLAKPRLHVRGEIAWLTETIRKYRFRQPSWSSLVVHAITLPIGQDFSNTLSVRYVTVYHPSVEDFATAHEHTRTDLIILQ